MRSYDKAVTRLILILTKLSDNEYPTIKELSDEFGVSVRTIQRDIYERLMYYPIEKNDMGQLHFSSGFGLSRSTLEKDEMLLVYLAMTQVKNISKGFENKINDVFSKLLNPTFTSSYYIKRKGFEELDIDSEIIKNIENAIQNNYVSIISSKKVSSQIKPYKVLNLDGLWYLFARDLEDDKIKNYLISNLDDFISTKEKFSLQTDINTLLSNVHSPCFEDGNTFDVIIDVNSNISHNFKLKKVISSQKILKEKPCGSLEIKFKVSHYEDIDNIVKGWLPDIKVIEPIEYKEKLENELREYLNY